MKCFHIFMQFALLLSLCVLCPHSLAQEGEIVPNTADADVERPSANTVDVEKPSANTADADDQIMIDRDQLRRVTRSLTSFSNTLASAASRWETVAQHQSDRLDKLDQSIEKIRIAMAAGTGDPPTPWLVIVLEICTLTMLSALGVALFRLSRGGGSPTDKPRARGVTDAPPDWQEQINYARTAEQQARDEVERARNLENNALAELRVAREAESKAVAEARSLSVAADAARSESQEIVRAAIEAFSSSENGYLREDVWLLALRDIARGLSKMSVARGDSPKDGLNLLAQWSRFLQGFSGKVCDFSLTLPGIGSNVDTSWMTPARSGTEKVARVVTWAVYTKTGVRYNAEVE